MKYFLSAVLLSFFLCACAGMGRPSDAAGLARHRLDVLDMYCVDKTPAQRQALLDQVMDPRMKAAMDKTGNTEFASETVGFHDAFGKQVVKYDAGDDANHASTETCGVAIGQEDVGHALMQWMIEKYPKTDYALDSYAGETPGNGHRIFVAKPLDGVKRITYYDLMQNKKNGFISVKYISQADFTQFLNK